MEDKWAGGARDAPARGTEENLDAARAYPMSTSDPLMLEYRVGNIEKMLERHETYIQATKDAVVEQRQAHALLLQEVRALREDAAAEIKAREKRDAAWEARVKRLTIAWFSVAGSLVAGAVTLALTVAGAQ